MIWFKHTNCLARVDVSSHNQCIITVNVWHQMNKKRYDTECYTNRLDCREKSDNCNKFFLCVCLLLFLISFWLLFWGVTVLNQELT